MSVDREGSRMPNSGLVKLVALSRVGAAGGGRGSDSLFRAGVLLFCLAENNRNVFSQGAGAQTSEISATGLKSRCQQLCAPSGGRRRGCIPAPCFLQLPWLVATSWPPWSHCLLFFCPQSPPAFLLQGRICVTAFRAHWLIQGSLPHLNLPP